jgi:GNAT superfamily N-acetyltransferase
MYEPIADGGVIRKLWIGEAYRYREHLLRLDATSRHKRFGGAVSDAYIRQHVETSTWLQALLQGFFVEGVLRGAAELRLIDKRSGAQAEVAFSVEEQWQGHGVGSVLLQRTLLVARNRGIKFLHMACLADNKRMQQLARKFDVELSFDAGGIVGEVATPRPTPVSILRELVNEGHSLGTAFLDAESWLLKPAVLRKPGRR